MRNWNKTAGILFMAASAVCSGRWIVAATAAPVAPATAAPAAKPGQDATADPFASSPATTQPGDGAAPATQPSDSGKGQSVTASQVNVSDSGTVEIHVNDANLVEVLRMLSLQSQKNIIASKEVHGTITANLYDVTVKEALDAVLHANGYDYREKGNFIYVYTTKEIQDMEQAARVKKTEVFRLYYINALNASTLIKPVIAADAQVALTTPAKAGLSVGSTGATGGDDLAINDVLVVTDFPENLEKVRKLLKEVDRRPQQVLVEATILRAQLNENNSLGIDFTVLGGVDFSTLGLINNAAPVVVPGTPNASAGVNSALSGSIVDSANTTSASGLAAGKTLTKGYVASQFGGHGLNLGIVTHDVGIFLQALETVTDTTVLANPKVLVVDKQQGEVHVGQNLGYKTAIATETLTASNVQFLDTGIRLIFRPYVGENGYVRMEIHPENSTGNIDANGNPQKTTTEITSNIMVRDGRTIVIGGLFEDSTTRTRSQVPFLGSLPGVGPLFRQQSDATIRQEVIVLLTPHIIKDYDAYGAASEEEAKLGERLRVGNRRGLMPWGRERLAESWYELAVQEMNKPHPNRQAALWHLNCAINLNPLFTEAAELRSQVSGKEVTATDDSTIRTLVRKQVLAERANPPADITPSAAVLLDDSSTSKQMQDDGKPAAGPKVLPTSDTQAPAPAAPATQPTAAAPAETPATDAPDTQPATASKDTNDVQFTYPSTQPADKSAGTATTNSPGDGFEDPTGDNNK